MGNTKFPAKKALNKNFQPNQEVLTVDAYAEEFAVTLMHGLNGLLDEQPLDKAARDAVVIKLLEVLVGTHVLQTLTDKSHKNALDVRSAFSIAKMAVSQAVSDAFSGAMGEYGGKPIEYYCKIALVPATITDTVN